VELAASWGLDCTGLDGAPQAVAMARGRGVEILEHRLSAPLPFADASFQTALLNQVIEHLEPETARAVVRECHRVLVPGGALLVTSPSAANRREAAADPTHIHLLAPAALRALLLGVGFARVEPFDEPLPFLGAGRLAKGLAVALFKLRPFDRLSATANAVAYR
jgi:SAM-dependent methyltransferase